VTHGPEKATELGLKLELAKGTLQSWFNTWAKAASTPRPVTSSEPMKPGSHDAYQVMICHFESIARFKRRNPHIRHLPEHLDQLEDEIMALCEKRGWVYPGKVDYAG
jgi:hypothetical protein